MAMFSGLKLEQYDALALVFIQTVGGMSREFGWVLPNVKSRPKADTVDAFGRSDSSEAAC